jgi:hypothetical protein
VEPAVAGAVTLAGVAVQALEQRTEQGEILVALQMVGLQGRLALARQDSNHERDKREHRNVLS